MNNLNPSRKLAARPRAGGFLALFLLAGWPAISVTQATGLAATNPPSAIPWNEIGAKAGTDYQGDGLAVTPTGSGARLHCVFQRLDGEATLEGLWLTSTVTNSVSDRFRVMATAVGRTAANATFNSQYPESSIPLADAGQVSVCGQTVRFSRPGLTEEYSVSMDGVRQDFIVEQAPLRPPDGELVVKLAVSGAQVETAADGARLVLTHSGRKMAYSRLRVTDATGKELPARIEIASAGDEAAGLNTWIGFDNDITGQNLLTPTLAKEELVVVVNDADAVYPVRIDPTFSDANWVSMGGYPGANGVVYTAVTDGSGNLFIGGTFSEVGEAFATNIAQWNGSRWLALGSGFSGLDAYGAVPSVDALAVSGGTLYAGGDFTNAGGIAANYIAQWNGSNWSALGSGMSSDVYALVVSGSTLYAGGDFTTAGGGAANSIARWNGSSWSALGSGMNGDVYALAVSGSTLYAGGYFTEAGGSTIYGIARWNGSNWSGLGSGMNSPVDALAVSGSTLYAGGEFTKAGGIAATNIAQWNGSSWSALGSVAVPYTFPVSVSSLAVSGGKLYAGVEVSQGNDFGYIEQWNGISWSLIEGLGANSSVDALAVSGSTLYAGGQFTRAGGSAAEGIAQWNGSSWSIIGSVGINNEVLALAVSGSTLYAGGYFTMAGNSAANYIAQWNGSSWSSLGSGVSGGDEFGPYVDALAVSGSTLYAAGNFTTAGDDANANNIAQWDGSNWSDLDSGMDVYVNALAVLGSTLYAGGDFSTAGDDTDANFIAQWNGSSWSSLGSGVNSEVLALAASGGTLFAGGYFTMAGGSAANSVARWNGSSWSSLGSGISGEGPLGGPVVAALVVSGSTLYAGGGFATAGGSAANCIAQWNGSSWSSLGSGMNNDVLALAASGGTLYAGGYFTTAGSDSNADGIAEWNGSSWSSLGSGVNGNVLALAVPGGTLFAGGDFTTAGTNVSVFVAMANLAGTQSSPAIITTDAAFGFTSGLFGFNVSGLSGASVVIEASTDLQTWIPLQTNALAGGLLYFSDTQPRAGPRRFYRAQFSP